MVNVSSNDEGSRLPPLFGIEEHNSIDAQALEQHVDAIAVSIRSALGDDGARGVTPYSFGITTLLYGMWVKDGAQTRYATNIQAFDQLETMLRDYDAQAQAPIDFMGSGQMFEPWTVLVGPKPAAYYWMSTTSADDFRSKDMELFEAGFRIVSFNQRHGRFNATWQGNRGGTQWVRWDMSYFDLLGWNAHFHAQGLRIAAIDRYGEGGNLYAAVWQPGDGPQIVEAAGGLNVYFGQPARLNVYRYRDRGLHVRAMGHNGYPAVVFRPTESRAEPIWYAAPPSYFKRRDDFLRGEGYRLDTVSHASWQFG